jgi:hypothetical protein
MTVLARPSPPDLQALVAQWGGYDKVPAEAWAGFDLAIARWRGATMTTPGAAPLAAPPSGYPETERWYTMRRWHWWVRYRIWFDTDDAYIEAAQPDPESAP